MIGASAVYQIAVALEVLSLGSEPGQGPPAAGVVIAIALLALLVGVGVSIGYVSRAHAKPEPVWLLLAPAGAAFVVARWYSFDPYFAPTLRRYSEGVVAGSWIVVLVGLAVGAAALVKLLPRAGGIVTAVVLLLCAVTAAYAGLGH